MKNFPHLSVYTCAVFSLFLTGATVDHTQSQPQAEAYVVNNSNYTIYYKPESEKANPGLDQNGAYPIAPGESLYSPIDAIATPALPRGKIYRVPTGATIIINADGIPHPNNLVARIGTTLSAYGTVFPNVDNFAKLANGLQVLYQRPDIVGAKAQSSPLAQGHEVIAGY
jgi:hypothetical protein